MSNVITQEPSRFECTVPSNDTLVIRELVVRVHSSMKERGWDEQLEHHKFYAVRLGLEEALVNAMKHGNGYDKDKSVRLIICVGTEAVTLEIEDEGDGFDESTVPDPTAEENLEKTSGRGIFLMRQYMSNVRFRNNGTRVCLELQRHEQE